MIKKYFESIALPQVTVEVNILHGGPVPFRSGGSIPIISTFEKVLGIKSILMGFGLESDGIHSPNENYPVWNFLKGIETITRFYHHYKASV